MNYKIFSPSGPFSELVQSFWTLESSRDEATPGKYFLMADNCPEIIFQYNGGFSTYSKQSARIRFQHSTYAEFPVEKELGFFGVRLYPHAAGQLLHIPATEVANQVFDFDTLFKQEGRDLTDQVYNAANTAERLALISGFLAKGALQHKKEDPINRFVRQIMEQEGQVDISHIQQQSGLSVKQFERRFKAITGFAPKYFARIARFQGAKKKYSSSRIKTLTRLAYACNYYDQSHFNREFKEFSGLQPKDISIAREQRAYDGYLPCGWFI